MKEINVILVKLSPQYNSCFNHTTYLRHYLVMLVQNRCNIFTCNVQLMAIKISIDVKMNLANTYLYTFVFLFE